MSPSQEAAKRFFHNQARILFIDMNAFFASVEQQENQALRGKPVIVVPVLAKTTCAIAASYEAKIFGIKTGSRVSEAQKICPALKIVQARPYLYVKYHDQILEILSNHFNEVQALSIDEMSCRLTHWQIKSEGYLDLAHRIKEEIYKTLGRCMRCSIGIAPNTFLAKIAADIIKPDGLTVFCDDYTPLLFKCSLRDLPGIGPRMEKRLRARGILSVEDLWSLSPEQMQNLWGGVIGKRWYYMLRGNLNTDYGRHNHAEKKSVSHSHVLPPAFRNVEGVCNIALRLTSKALKRLRVYKQDAKQIYVCVTYRHNTNYSLKHKWRVHASAPCHTNDDFLWFEIINSLLTNVMPLKDYRPAHVVVVFFDLALSHGQQLPLFNNRDRYKKLAGAVDQINARFGYVIDLAAVYWIKKEAPFRIAFGVTEAS